MARLPSFRRPALAPRSGRCVLIFANQYEAALFDSAPPLAVRWHPPTRAQRIRALLAARERHDAPPSPPSRTTGWTTSRAAAPAPAPRVAYRHTLRRHPLGRLLFAAGHAFDGGSRETVHVLRRNADFLTGRQAGDRDATRPYSFGPAFKLVMDLSPAGEIHYAANTPSSGVALGVALAPALRRWRRGLRYRSSV